MDVEMNVQHTRNESRDESVFQLIHGIFQDARSLLSKEFLAARLETKQEIASIIKASISLLIGAGVLSIGVVLLSLMLVFLLVDYAELPLWSGLGIVGLVYCVAGIVVMVVGKKSVSHMNPVPERTVQSAKEDVRHIGEKIAGH